MNTMKSALLLARQGLAAALCATAISPAAAGLEILDLGSEWQGRYVDEQGGEMIIQYNAGALEIFASDRGSHYRLVCIVDSKAKTRASCVGDGINHQRAPTRFTYRSKLVRADAATLQEEWEASFPGADSSGKTVFRAERSSAR